MKSFIFITTEGFTFQPGSENSESDIENCQVIGFAQGQNEQKAFENLVQENPYLIETTFDKIICIELKHANHEKYSRHFHLMDYRSNKYMGDDDAYVRKIQLLTQREQDNLVDACEHCNYCGEPFKECDTLIPGFGIVAGEVNVVKYLGKFWHFGCIEEWHKEKLAG